MANMGFRKYFIVFLTMLVAILYINIHLTFAEEGELRKKLYSLYEQKKDKGCDMEEVDRLIEKAVQLNKARRGKEARKIVEKAIKLLVALEPSIHHVETGKVDIQKIQSLYQEKEEEGYDMLEVDWLIERAVILSRLGKKEEAVKLLKEAEKSLGVLKKKVGQSYHEIGNPFSNPMGIYCFGADRNAHILASLGVKWTRDKILYHLPDEEGKYNWDGQFPLHFKNCSKVGIQLFPVILFNPESTRTQGMGFGDRRPSSPPDDLLDKEDDVYGYSRTYYDYVRSIVKAYKDSLSIVTIENEADFKMFWRGTKEEYIKVLKTAYKAAHSVNPDIVVTDSGFTSGSWGVMIVRDYLNSGKFSREEALEFLRKYYKAHGEQVSSQLRTAEDVEKFLNLPIAKETYDFVDYCMKNFEGSIDTLNFHFYEDYQFLPTIVEWLKMKMGKYGYQIPITCNEMGIHNIDPEYDVEGLQLAADVFKKIVTAITLKIQPIIWFPIGYEPTAKASSVSKNIVGLFNEDYSPRPAMNTFKYIATELAQNYEFSYSERNGPKVYHYVFKEKKSSLKNLHILWNESGKIQISSELVSPFTKATIKNVLGKEIETKLIGNKIQMSLTSSPIVVRLE